MNIEETKVAIAVMQAFVEGKKIEWMVRGSPWQEVEEPVWSWNEVTYRVKREPREFWVNIYESRVVTYRTKDSADFNAANDRIACVHVREVLEEAKP